MMKSGSFTFINRAEIGPVLQEQRSDGLRLADPHLIRQLGPLTGVGAMTTVSVET